MSSDKIFRFMNFFDLFTLLEHGSLRIPRVTEFDDKNEGYGFLLDALQVQFTLLPAAFSPPGTTPKESTYISCWTKSYWTKQPDAAAMWLTYSKTTDAFLVQTTREKLAAALNKYEDHYATEPGRFPDFMPKCRDNIADVTYINFTEKKRRLKQEMLKSEASWRG